MNITGIAAAGILTTSALMAPTAHAQEGDAPRGSTSFILDNVIKPAQDAAVDFAMSGMHPSEAFVQGLSAIAPFASSAAILVPIADIENSIIAGLSSN